MSSRRKSKPARWIESICNKLKESSASAVVASQTKNEAEQDDSRNDNQSADFSPEISGPQLTDDKPEGVYVIEPESVSDNEGSQRRMKAENTEDLQADVEDKRKRPSMSDDAVERSAAGESSSGLDLSVKRQKVDQTYGEQMDLNKTNSLAPFTLPSSMLAHAQGNDIMGEQQLKKYQQLVALLATGKSLLEAMDEAGLSTQQFMAMHWLNQFNPSDANHKEMPNEGFENGPKLGDEELMQQQKQIALVSRPQPSNKLTNGSKVPVPPLFNMQDHPADDTQAAYRDLLLRTYSLLPQNQSPGPSKLVPEKRSDLQPDSIAAGTVSSGVGSIKRGTLDPSNFDEDVFDQYIAKFTNANRCGLLTCQYYTRDHYHCVVEDCNYQRFTNKADVIRHYNMHKKRDNSLAHGFLRFSPTDNCSTKYPDCHLNGKSTHYHCMQPDCNKVYTSTSDVMTHENFHKKYMQFVCSGFKRFRATEQCDLESCVFRNQKTTHFHCTRSDCNFTFKNKCDIEKHKTYHLRDDQYIRKGFKKFYKNETCRGVECVWNQTANHFHCLRPGCNFSFTSTSQMESHKRKHDRNDYLGETKEVPALHYQDPTFSDYSSSVSQRVSLSSAPESKLLLRKIVPSSYPVSTVCQPAFLALGGPVRLPTSSYLTWAKDSVINMKSHPFTSFQHPLLPPLTSRIAAVASCITKNALDSPRNSSAEVSQFNPIEFSNARSFITSLSSVSRSPKLNTSVPDSTIDNAQNASNGSPASLPLPALRFQPGMHVDDDSVSASTPLFSQLPVSFVTSSSTPKSATIRNFDGNNDTGNGIFTPDTSTSAASSSNFVEDNDEQISQSGKSSLKAAELDCVTKYLSRSAALKCEISDCEFFTKDHYHCMVGTCEAAFASDAAVLKHARFHLNLELLGVSLPLQGRPAIPSNGGIPAKFNLEDPTLRSIAVPSTLAQSSLPSESTSPRVPSEAQCDVESSKASSAADMVPYTRTLSLNTDFLRNQPTQIHPSILKGVLSQNEACQSLINNSAFRNLDFLSVLSPALASSIPKPPAASLAESRGDGNPRSFGSGYMHFRLGMPCLRNDCKYTRQNHWHCTINRCRYVCKSLAKAENHKEAHSSLDAYARAAKECFRSYSVKKQCPNPSCEFKLRGHYHCLRPGCSFVTIGTSKLPWHMKKHEKIAKREASGFKYFTKKENYCKYNGHFSHYHCIRKNCTFAFQYKHQMSTHVRKHLRRMLGRNSVPAPGQDMDVMDHSNVESGDDGPSLVIDEMEDEQQSLSTANSDQDPQEVAMQQFDDSSADKLQNFDEDSSDKDDEAVLDLSSMPVNRELQNLSQVREDRMSDNAMAMDTNEHDTTLGLENYNGSEMSNNAGPSPVTQSNPEIGRFGKFKLEDSILSGFQKFDANQDCGDKQCAFLHKVAHYHCTEENCNYRFTGRSHMFKHYQHHERVAGLVRNDFRRYKATQICKDADCEHKGKHTHFHCLRCNFKCTDSAKVGTHRRQHMKADALQQSGFMRVRGKDDCGRSDCKYRFRSMSHFHCLQPGCSYAIVGLTGIELHAEKHKRGLIGRNSKAVNLAARSLISLQSLSQLGVGLNDSSSSSNMMPQVSSECVQNPAEIPPSPTDGSDNGYSNRSSPLLPQTQDEPQQIISNFTILSSSQTPMMATSPVSSNPLNRVTEGVGS